MATTGKAQRNLFLTYLDVTPDASSPTYELMGDGITDMSVSYNAQTEEETYIHEVSGTTTVTGYQPTISATATMFVGDPVLEFLDDLRMQRAVLAASQTTIINVYKYTAADGAVSFTAERQRVSVQFDDFGGAGGESLSFGFTLNYIGDHSLGEFDPATGTYTAN